MREKLPFDVQRYRAKVFLFFTRRQAILASICVGVDLFLLFLSQGAFKSYLPAIDIIIIIFAFPVYNVIPLEQYLSNIINWYIGTKTLTFLDKKEKIKPKQLTKKEEKALNQTIQQNRKYKLYH